MASDLLVWRVIKERRSRWALVFVLVVIGIFLRSVNLGNFAPIKEYESSWVSMGNTLLNKGILPSWQERREKFYSGQPVDQTVIPYLEFPPVFSLMVSEGKNEEGVKSGSLIDRSATRYLMIAVATLSMILTYLLINKLYGKVTALTTLAAYVFFPTSVVTARFVVAEHLIGVMLLLAIYGYVIFSTAANRTVKRISWVLLIALSFLAIWVKLSAVIIPLGLILLASSHRNFKLAVTILFALLVSIFIFYGYAFFWDGELLRQVWLLYEAQDLTFTDAWMFIVFLNIGNYLFYDPSVIVGAIGLLLLIIKDEERQAGQYFMMVLLAVLALLLFRSPQEHFGWQRYILQPFLAVGLGHVFTQLGRGKMVYLVLFLPLLSLIFQHANIVTDLTNRKVFVAAIYFAALFPWLIGKRHLPIREVYILLLAGLFLLETWWAIQTLGL